MNSLRYISRQFDVFAVQSNSSPATPSTSSELSGHHGVDDDSRPSRPIGVRRSSFPTISRKRSSGRLRKKSLGSNSAPSTPIPTFPMPRASPSPRSRRRRRMLLRSSLSTIWQLLCTTWLWLSRS
ncbi:uncharacterized protein EI90DRAFT_3281686, partial [Cantharellus anzutake]|uniref:uncharacterized protein n=1 Tax=Cantharellus anzutake TaxID=1750568 RepID=UPI00190339E6